MAEKDTSSNKDKKAKKTNSAKSSKAKRIIKYIFLTLIALTTLSFVALAGVAFAIIQTSPALDVEAVTTLSEPSVIYDDNNQVMDSVITDKSRKIVSINETSKYLQNAIVAVEDERFYTHNGLDYKRLAGALLTVVKSKFDGSEDVQGGSTITQQLIKQVYFLNDSLTQRLNFKRKIQEMYLATKLEKKLTKDQILETYMNTIFLGGQAHGVGAAADQYFNKPASQLTLVESAFIAGLGQSPSRYYPFSDKNQQDHSLYINRTKTVLEQMLKNNFISNDDYNNALNEINSKSIAFDPGKISNEKLKYEYFTTPLLTQITKDLKEKYNYDDDYVNNLIYNGGLKIYSTMNKEMEESTKSVLDADESFPGLYSKNVNGIPKEQAAGVIIENSTGNVKAIVGGRGNQPPGSYNRAAQDGEYMPSNLLDFTKPPGSSIKPLTVYGPAINEKVITAGTEIDDTEMPASEYKNLGYTSKPNNWDYLFKGKMNVRTSIKQSRNIPALRIENMLGIQKGFDYGNKLHLNLDSSDKAFAPLALGEIAGTTPLRMAAAFSVFANGGVYQDPKFYTKIVDRRGLTILEATHKTETVFTPQTAYIMFQLLKGPVSSGGTGPAANFGSMPVGGKTGTSGDNKNLWFTGLTPYYSGAVWLGYDDSSPLPSLSSNSIANAWGKMMKYAHKDKEYKEIDKPSGITSVYIDKQSGLIATDYCKAADAAYSEYFISGTEPSALCTLHQAAKPTIPENNNNNSGNTNSSDTNNTTNNTNTNNNSNTNTNTNNNSNNNTNNANGGNNTNNTTNTNTNTTNNNANTNNTNNTNSNTNTNTTNNSEGSTPPKNQ